ncbi:GNAT family N-acetyltransferase [Planococcus sp. CP5-4]|uniref:GNAT family N-acetyltransferase n=1 Tax=unclassified Planococcus (in: firmicutes) TaxID=2662419 RepID=UPI001C2225F0|nr:MULTISPECIES: GNAT family N-acetyltransferase [unclassified Planococcus (in: firmicutes)]MBU9673085.1 GNAT family N-acetyltransferase [Planococcus sp. CP5-4_YE]MBV0908331.1 GNAT family N-acetyltransferase [Planococcus sp. CP5-4_UN]MBW6062393.1 GNAT family N-acetyltransferase [Planococcus sp. CP5-4]
MELSLSIASFPLDAETAGEMERLIASEPEECRTLLQNELWQKSFAKGFAVLAYTNNGELVACAAAADLVGVHHYEWSAFVSSDYRRLGLATALADGVQHSLAQRGAESELAAFTENEETDAWLMSLGYKRSFQELQFEAAPLPAYELAEGMEVIPYEEKHLDELEVLLCAAFDESVLPVLEHNLADPERQVYVMRQNGKLIATATMSMEDQAMWLTALAVSPDAQRSGNGQFFLQWARHAAHEKDLARVLIEVETGNRAWPVYEKAGFSKLYTISYWQRPLQ